MITSPSKRTVAVQCWARKLSRGWPGVVRKRKKSSFVLPKFPERDCQRSNRVSTSDIEGAVIMLFSIAIFVFAKFMIPEGKGKDMSQKVSAKLKIVLNVVMYSAIFDNFVNGLIRTQLGMVRYRVLYRGRCRLCF